MAKETTKMSPAGEEQGGKSGIHSTFGGALAAAARAEQREVEREGFNYWIAGEMLGGKERVPVILKIPRGEDASQFLSECLKAAEYPDVRREMFVALYPKSTEEAGAGPFIGLGDASVTESNDLSDLSAVSVDEDAPVIGRVWWGAWGVYGVETELVAKDKRTADALQKEFDRIVNSEDALREFIVEIHIPGTGKKIVFKKRTSSRRATPGG